ncbi:MMPL family transporter [Brachybacterium huguangmaarense]
MSSSLYRLGRAMARARWKVVGAWGLLLVVLGLLAVGLGGQLSAQFEIPGTQAQEGLDELATRFPQLSGTSGQIVFTTDDGSSVDDHAAAIQEAMGKASEVPGVEAAPDPFAEVSPGTRSADDTAIIGSVQMTGQPGTFPDGSLEELDAIVSGVDDGGLEAHLGGQILQETGMPVGISEVIGVIAALVVLAVTFRAILPAVIPITTAIVGIAISMAALLALAAGVDIPSVTPTLAIMLGLAVGIDYALFIVSRHRNQLARGMDVTESIGESIATAGSAVIFAGMTVIIALVGLFITRIPFLTLMGLASAATVAIAVVLALTLLPAILALLGERLRPRAARRAMADNGGRLPDAPAEEVVRPTAATRWVRLVTRVPLLTIVVVVLGIGALALPARDMRLGLPDLGTERPDTKARQTYDLVSERFGPGYNGPLLVTADIINTTDPLGVMDALKSRISDLPGVAAIQLATPNEGADMGVVVVIPEGGQTDESTADLVRTLRADAPGWEKDLGISDMKVTGQTAVAIDITDRLSSALLPFGVFVVGLSLLLLAIVFRSIWVPIKASLGYLLSLGAAFGAVAMVFEYGWGNAALNVHVIGPVISFMPIMVMGILFGLAMDYEVFLVSRMREEYVHTGDPRGAIERGFTASAPVVVAAALIMISVFASFVPEGTFMIQPIAVALAVGIFVDAFVVRMTLVPAVLALLGHHAWTLPGWLDRRLPHMDVEGEGLVRVLEHQRWTEENDPASVRLEAMTAPLVGTAGHLAPLSATARPGSLVLVTGDQGAVDSVLGVLAGRLHPDDGIVAVHDRLVPDEAGALQARTHLVAAGSDVAARLGAIGEGSVADRTLVIERAEDLADAGQGAISRLETLLRHGATAVVGDPGIGGETFAGALRDALEVPDRLVRIDVHADAASDGAPENSHGADGAVPTREGDAS